MYYLEATQLAQLKNFERLAKLSLSFELDKLKKPAGWAQLKKVANLVRLLSFSCENFFSTQDPDAAGAHRVERPNQIKK